MMRIPWSRPGRELKYAEANAGCVYVSVKQKYSAWTLINAEHDTGKWAAIAHMCKRNAGLLIAEGLLSDSPTAQHCPASWEKNNIFFFSLIIWRGSQTAVVYLKFTCSTVNEEYSHCSDCKSQFGKVNVENMLLRGKECIRSMCGGRSNCSSVLLSVTYWSSGYASLAEYTLHPRVGPTRPKTMKRRWKGRVENPEARLYNMTITPCLGRNGLGREISLR